jgi:predicted O-methyltransferase YrrM
MNLAEKRAAWVEYCEAAGYDKDLAIRLEAAEWIAEHFRPLDVLELGAGFSTALFLDLARRSLVTVEHDPIWMGLTEEYVERRALVPFGIGSGTLEQIHAGTKRPEWRAWPSMQAIDTVAPLSFDLILVDGGPEMQDRLESIPYAWEMLADDGVMILDDWRKRYRRQAHRMLDGLGAHVERVDLGRTLGVARR